MANNKPITISATTAVWMYSGSGGARINTLMANIERGEHLEAINSLSFYGSPEREAFGDSYVRVGEAQVTVTLIPRDEQTRMAVEGLNKRLAKLRAEYHRAEQALLRDISKLSAIEYVEAV